MFYAKMHQCISNPFFIQASCFHARNPAILGILTYQEHNQDLVKLLEFLKFEPLNNPIFETMSFFWNGSS